MGAGWSVEELNKDYGEDLLVRIFDDGSATPFAFFVQAKAVTDMTRCMAKRDPLIRYSYDLAHLELWEKYWHPVIVTLWDATSDKTYWEIIQEPDVRKRHGKTVYFAPDNLLNHEGMMRIRARVRRRHQRLEDEKRGADALIDLLRDALELKDLDYNPNLGLLCLTYKDGSGGITFFGPGLRLIAAIEEKGEPVNDETINRILQQGLDHLTSMTSDWRIRDSSGAVIHDFRTFEEYKRWRHRQGELSDD